MSGFSTDRSVNEDAKWTARYGDAQTVTVAFSEDVSDRVFTVVIYRVGTFATMATLSEGNGKIVNNGDDIEITLDGSNATIDPDTYEYVLKDATPFTWFCAPFVLNRSGNTGPTTSSISVEVNTGDVVVDVEITIPGSGGGGDVVGPASAVASRMVEFDGITGKLIKDGGVVVSAFMKTLLDDSSLANFILSIGGWTHIYKAGLSQTINPTAYTDITELSFAVEAGILYEWQAVVAYNASATSIGAGFAVNGTQSITHLSYAQSYANSTTVNFIASYASFDPAATVTANSTLTTGNKLLQWGTVRMASNDTIILRAAAESGGTITIQGTNQSFIRVRVIG